MMLLAIIAFGGSFIISRRAAPPRALDLKIAELQSAIAKPDAKPATWLAYAQTLQAAHQYAKATIAFQHFLETDPYQRDARMACAACVAQLGDKDAFFRFMDETISLMPKTAVDIFSRPEAAPYLADARFQDLQQKAAAGAMD